MSELTHNEVETNQNQTAQEDCIQDQVTEKITPIEILKSKQKFSDFIEEKSQYVIDDLLKDCPHRGVQIVIPQLTPNTEGLIDSLKQLSSSQRSYIFWFIANEREDLLITLKNLNQIFVNGCGIFVIKTFLNEDKLDFECILKPELKTQVKRTINVNTPTKLLQKTYWEQYIDVCDASEYPEMQIKEALPRHYQYVSIQKAGVQILQTVNTVENYVASEITISNDKTIFEKLLIHKEEIEKEIGTLEWDSKETNKSSKIRKTFEADINHTNDYETFIQEHVKMGAQLKAVVHKYL